jgi:hypothetical protein
MKLGPIGGVDQQDKPLPSHHDRVQALAKRRCKRRDRHGTLSMRFAEHGGEGHLEDLFAVIIADVQDPVAPILRSRR